MRASATTGGSGRETLLSSFAQAAGWRAIASGLATLRFSDVQGPTASPALRLDYDFGSGSGFVVAKHEIALAPPETWELRFFVRGEAPANNLEIKFVDVPGTSVWWWKKEHFAPPGEWTELVIPSRDVVFAWGPAGGGTVPRTSAVELAVTAGPAGKGHLELAGFRIVDRTPRSRLVVEASSSKPDHEADAVLGDDVETSWQSKAGAGPHTLKIDLGEEREVGGIVVRWAEGAEPRSLRVESRASEGPWKLAYDAAIAGAATSFLPLRELRARWLTIAMMAGDAARGVGIRDIDVMPVEWSRTPVEFLTNVAMATPRGRWPRYLLREQTYWTPVATPRSGAIALLSDDAAVEIGEAGFMLEPSLLTHDGEAPRWLRWPDVERRPRLEQAALPVGTVCWTSGDIALETMAVAEDHHGDERVLLRYRIANHGSEPLCTTLLVGVRPLQVTPPWQAYRALGGPSPITSIDEEDGDVVVNDRVRLRPLSPCRGFGAAGFDEGGIATAVLRGELPERRTLADAAGAAEGVFAFDLEVEPDGEALVHLEARMPARWHLGVTAPECETDAALLATADAEERVVVALKDWAKALPSSTVSGHAGAVAAAQCAFTAVGHILCCRDGAALQPGPRRYQRSWIRDGAIMSAALLRAGLPETARSFVEWYARQQREDGFVPCCVDREGVDPLVEHDSHGQLVYAVAEIHRFTHDDDFARKLWPHCASAVAYIESIRATRCTVEFESGPRKDCFGLLPESVSHEGYLAQPVHAYWDDFWALRGLRDAAYLARVLGHPDEEARLKRSAAELADAVASSIRAVMKERGLETVPASVEWADFDPTAIAGAISLVGAQELFPTDALAKTFDRYMEGFRAHRDGRSERPNYAPYEVRVIGALVCMGRRDDANELLDALLADRRPISWNQWPEIAWRDPLAPAHLGDLPHCWIGAEYAIALRWLFVQERERDGALVIGAGLRREWIDAGIDLKGLPTWYGNLDLHIARQGEVYEVTIGGEAEPPGGFVLELPGTATLRRL